MVAPQSLTEATYQAVKRSIIRCDLLPGAELTELEIAQRCNVGKTPVREALARLVQEGLMKVVPRRGYVVAPINVKDLQDFFALRLLLEPEAARLAAGRVDVEQLRQLDEICRAGYDPGDAESAASFLEMNTRFHETIARASGNHRLADLVAQLLYEMERLFHMGLRMRNRTEEMAHEHRDLVNALAQGNGDLARDICIDQIQSAQAMVMAGVFASPELMTVSLSAVS